MLNHLLDALGHEELLVEAELLDRALLGERGEEVGHVGGRQALGPLARRWLERSDLENFDVVRRRAPKQLGGVVNAEERARAARAKVDVLLAVRASLLKDVEASAAAHHHCAVLQPPIARTRQNSSVVRSECMLTETCVSASLSGIDISSNRSEIWRCQLQTDRA